MRIAILRCTARKSTMFGYLGPTVDFAWDKADLQKKPKLGGKKVPQNDYFLHILGGLWGVQFCKFEKNNFWIVKKTPKTK